MPAHVFSPRLLGAIVLLTGLSLALSAESTSDGGRSRLGRRERIGAGTVQSFLTLDRSGVPLALGVTLSPGALEQLPQGALLAGLRLLGPVAAAVRHSGRVAVEAASPLGWHRWVGDRGAVVAMTTFGASAPAGALYKHFGFTGENVADVARGVLGQ